MIPPALDDLDRPPRRRLECLDEQAVHRGHLRDSEAGFIRFASTAAYCLRVGDKPAALFAYLVRAGEYPAMLQDEVRAMEDSPLARRIKALELWEASRLLRSH